MICKKCSIDKQAAYFSLKHLLPAGIEHPVFHSTSFTNAEKILSEGFKARAGGTHNDAYHDNSVCFSRDLCFSEKDQFGGGQVIFVLDLNKLKHKFKTYSTDWYSRNIDPRVKQDPRPIEEYTKKHDRHEYEERASVSPKYVRDAEEPETTVPAKYIEAVIVKQSDKSFEWWKQLGYPKNWIVRTSTNRYKKATSSESFFDLDKMLVDNVTHREVGVGGVDRVVQLLKAGADPNAYQGSAIIGAVNRGGIDIVRLLFEYGARYAKFFDSLLIRPSRRGDTAVVKILLEHGANAKSEYGGTSILEASFAAIKHPPNEQDYREIVSLLLQYGADPRMIDSDYKDVA